MHTFEITIQRKNEEGMCPIVVEQSKDDALPIRTEGRMKLDLKQLIAQPTRLAYGTTLGQALFGDVNIGQAFAQARAAGQHDPEGLRILLTVEDPDLKPLYWERLCAPDQRKKWRFLSRSQNFRLSHYLPSLSERLFMPINRHEDLKALLLVANPGEGNRFGLARFNAEAMIEGIAQSLGQIPYDVLAMLEVSHKVGPPTLKALKTQLTAQPYTLLHVVAHGGYSPSRKETALFLIDEDDQIQPVWTSELIDQLNEVDQVPHFIFLSTCESATPEAEAGGALGGLAQELIRELGTPAVVAMTEKVSIQTATTVADHFYGYLYDSGLVDKALVQAAAGLTDEPDLTVPALYSRLRDRHLFEVNRAEATPADIETGLQRLEAQLRVHAPILLVVTGHQPAPFIEQAAIVRRTVGKETAQSKDDYQQAYNQVNQWCERVLDLTFNTLALLPEDELPSLVEDVCPFPGLKAFQPDDRPFFFGREKVVETLAARLAEHNFLAVLGASGSGKSSVVLAGLVPYLQSKATEPEPHLIYLTPGSDPVAALAAGRRAISADQPFVLVVDQFEELFTHGSDNKQRQQFIDQFQNLISTANGKVVLTMRADFWGDCAPYTNLKTAMQDHQYLLAPMTTAELRSAMEQQARQAGLVFEADLSHTILAEVEGEPGAMPLLQHLLREMWKRRHGSWLLTREYRALGGIQKAIAGTANEIYHGLESDSDKTLVREIFLRLTRVDEIAYEGEARRDTRRRVPFSKLVLSGQDKAQVERLVEKLASARLLVTNVSEASGEKEVEVTHEALIRHWPLLTHWLDAERAILRLRLNIENASNAWHAAPVEIKGDHLTHRGGRLEDIEAHLRDGTLKLDQEERAYIDACVALRQAEEDKEKQHIEELETALSRARAGEMTAYCQTELNNNNTDVALILAREAVLSTWLTRTEAMTKPFITLQADAVLRQAIAQAGQRSWRSTMPWRDTDRGSVRAVAISPDGRQIVTGGDDRMVRVWSAETWEMLRQWRGHTLTVNAVAISPDGRQIVTGGYDGTVRMWSAETGEELRQLRPPGPIVYAVAISADGQQIVSGSDETVRVWSAETGEELRQLSGHTDNVRAVAISADGRQIVTGGDDGTVRVWSAETGEELWRLDDSLSIFYAVAISADGRQIVTGSKSGTVRVWSAETGKILRQFISRGGSVYAVTISPDGQQIVTGGDGGTVRVWSAETGEELRQ
ncbi:MAG: CHAT domain-containing protein, partial [Anaerolineae bacterium]|nr:CHAT domain-containing protein [Anaerolineae bacterium]